MDVSQDVSGFTEVVSVGPGKSCLEASRILDPFF